MLWTNEMYMLGRFDASVLKFTFMYRKIWRTSYFFFLFESQFLRSATLILSKLNSYRVNNNGIIFIEVNKSELFDR